MIESILADEKPRISKFSSLREVEDFLRRGAIYSADSDQAYVGWQSSESAKSHGRLFRFFSPQFFFEETDGNAWSPARRAIVRCPDLEEFLQTYLATQSGGHSPAPWQPVTRDAFVEQFVTLKALINHRAILKGVPYGQTQTVAPVGPQWIARRLLAALQNRKGSYLYGCWNKDQGLIGCSPERLCQYAASTRSLTTEAVAGTTPLVRYKPGALLKDEKARREHAFVIDDLSERLHKLGPLEIGATYECQVAGLVHLKTPIRVVAEGKDVTMNEIVRYLHPTAALGVYPRNRDGYAWLEEANRRLPRGRFGAPFGISYNSVDGAAARQADFSFLVAIRNVQWKGHDLRINAGCGVIKSSQLECEWDECLSKIESIRSLLDL